MRWMGSLDRSYAARGSAGEVRSMLHFVERSPETAHLRSQISDLKSLSESCWGQIRAWANSLQNTDIKGQRHLTNTSRAEYDMARRREEFNRQIQEILRKAHPEIYGKPHEED